ncbi:HK97 gp10 family phage protein [Caballeronia sp. EK]|uniref:HK97-gp10 family putative phage morphogenesis protein n=1 Tax=Caballeronia sp. EK TaxID=2767469 RepID=UPI00198A6203|nr:HK97-gp10 family putative phage morphogenesis protein [Caballeronia sp. EK]MBC8638270.1 HK97 gp10 family phage protein [Caballeronia sp. EK]
MQQRRRHSGRTAMIKIDSHVEGLAELDRFLATLPEEVQRKMLSGSLRDAAKPIMDQAALNVLTLFGGSPRSSGVLFSHITRSKTKRTGLAARVNVTLKRPRGAAAKQGRRINGVYKPFGDDPFYGRFLEFGTSKMPARSWLRTAGIAKQDEAGTTMNRALQKRMAAWCKRNGVRFMPGV